MYKIWDKLSYLLVHLQGSWYPVHMWIKALWTAMLVERVGSKKYGSQMLDDYMICFIIFNLDLKAVNFFTHWRQLLLLLALLKLLLE